MGGGSTRNGRPLHGAGAENAQGGDARRRGVGRGGRLTWRRRCGLERRVGGSGAGGPRRPRDRRGGRRGGRRRGAARRRRHPARGRRRGPAAQTTSAGPRRVTGVPPPPRSPRPLVRRTQAKTVPPAEATSAGRAGGRWLGRRVSSAPAAHGSDWHKSCAGRLGLWPYSPPCARAHRLGPAAQGRRAGSPGDCGPATGAADTMPAPWPAKGCGAVAAHPFRGRGEVGASRAAPERVAVQTQPLKACDARRHALYGRRRGHGARQGCRRGMAGQGKTRRRGAGT